MLSSPLLKLDNELTELSVLLDSDDSVEELSDEEELALDSVELLSLEFDDDELTELSVELDSEL